MIQGTLMITQTLLGKRCMMIAVKMMLVEEFHHPCRHTPVPQTIQDR
jgi:hypothetical protein